MMPVPLLARGCSCGREPAAFLCTPRQHQAYGALDDHSSHGSLYDTACDAIIVPWVRSLFRVSSLTPTLSLRV